MMQTQAIRWNECVLLKPFQWAGRRWLLRCGLSGVKVVVVLLIEGRQNCIMLVNALRMKCVLSFITCRVKKTIRYQNSISPTGIVNIVPYSSPMRKSGTCKQSVDVNPTTQYPTCTRFLSKNMSKGKIQKQISCLPFINLQRLGNTKSPKSTCVTRTIMKKNFILCFQLNAITPTQQMRISMYVNEDSPRQWFTMMIGMPDSGRIKLLILHGCIDKVNAMINNSQKYGKLPSFIKNIMPTNVQQPIKIQRKQLGKENLNRVFFTSINSFCLADRISSVSLQNCGTCCLPFVCCYNTEEFYSFVSILISQYLSDIEVLRGLKVVLREESQMSSLLVDRLILLPDGLILLFESDGDFSFFADEDGVLFWLLRLL